MTAVALTILAVLLVAFGLGLYVAVALGLTALSVGLVFIGPVWDFFAMIPWNVASNSTIIVVPLFILMGEILVRSGITEELYVVLAKWLSRVPGNLLHTNILACGVFAAVSGSSVATATTIGSVSLPSLRRQGYDERLALGSLAAGGTLGILIPPSVIMIVYGLLAEVSIGQLYIAGVVPGLLMMCAFMATILVMLRLSPGQAPKLRRAQYKRAEMLVGLSAMLPVVILILLVLGTIYLGVATATEAAAYGASGAFVIALAKRRVNMQMLGETFRATAATTGMVIFILIGAFLLQFVLSFVGLSLALSNWVVGMGLSQIQVILLLCAIYLVLGTLVESLAMVVTTLPIIVPMLNSLHVDMVWFGIVTVILVELSLITPPVGMNLFVLQGVRTRVAGGRPDMPITDLYVGSLPFVLAMLAVLAVIIAFPDVAVWLVGKAMAK
jgi:C4-dicarboxylate transporter DctM subunit